MIKNLLLVGLGGGIGSMLRYTAGLFINSKHFPYATLAVNIVGSFIIGMIITLALKEQALSNNWKLFLTTGICGGFTTFSAFSIENMLLFQGGKAGIAVLYIMISIVLGIGAAFLGYHLTIKN